MCKGKLNFSSKDFYLYFYHAVVRSKMTSPFWILIDDDVQEVWRSLKNYAPAT
ncbi:hypothetical protein QTG54_006227 [Skeletonema marinoi]|uniref:Uncharacterized protein n=1 Tax=Skeletonema marinoi TaxID=267567 RepID=A0AAD8YBR1_9STRA|nr:hypothetical protein QTG54_006227 [Skeletonema marinoi]